MAKHGSASSSIPPPSARGAPVGRMGSESANDPTRGLLANVAAVWRRGALVGRPLPGGVGPAAPAHYRQIVSDYRPVFTGAQAW